MKKFLLGTSALVLVAGAAAAQQVSTKAPFVVTLGGSVRADAVYVSDKLADQNAREARFDYQLKVKAEAKAENGLVYGAQARIRNNQDAGNQVSQDVAGIDQKFIYLSGGWGKVNLGDTADASSELEVQAPTVGIGQADYPWGTKLGQYGYYHYNEGKLATKVVYLTPKFSGFQAGISFTPERGSTGRDSARSKFVTGKDNTYRDHLSLGAQYNDKFGDIGLKVGAGYETASNKPVSQAAPSAVGDFSVWHLGAQAAYAGFTFGAHYFDNGESGLAKGSEQTGRQVGLTYEIGPWGVGASFAQVKSSLPTDVAGTKKNSTDTVWGVGGAYKLADGLVVQADVDFFDAETQTKELKPNAKKNEGSQFTLRTRVDF